MIVRDAQASVKEFLKFPSFLLISPATRSPMVATTARATTTARLMAWNQSAAE
jgi:hypothetical protein